MPRTRGIRAGRAFVELGVNDRLTAGLRRAQRRLRAFGAGLRRIGLQLVAAGGAAATAFAPMVRIFARAGDELDKMSRRTGITVESLSELGFAAEQSGADLATLERGVRTMQRSIVDLERGLSTQADAFGALGLSIRDLRDLSPEEQFKLVAERLSQVEDPTRRAAIAMQILGRSGSALLPLMQEGARGIEELQDQARRFGLTISTQTARDAARFTDAMNILRRVLRITAVVIGSALAPAIERVVGRVIRIGVATNDWIKENRQLTVTIARVALGVLAVGAALVAASLILTLIAGAFGGLAAILTTVTAVATGVSAAIVFLLSPMGLVAAAAVALGVAFLRSSGRGAAAMDFLRERFASLAGTVGRTLDGIRDALAGGDIALAARVLWQGVQAAFLEGTSEVREIFADTMLTMRLVFADTLAAMSRLWARFQSGLRGAQEETGSFLARRFVELKGLFDDSFDVDQAKRDLADIASSNRTNREGDLARDLQQIDRAQQERTSRILDDAAEKMDDRRKALDDAKRELDASLAEARSRREDAELSGDSPFLNRFRDLINDLDAAGEGLGRRLETRGTFDAVAIQRLFGGGQSNAVDRTAKASEETARNTERIYQSVRDGAVFT